MPHTTNYPHSHSLDDGEFTLSEELPSSGVFIGPAHNMVPGAAIGCLVGVFVAIILQGLFLALHYLVFGVDMPWPFLLFSRIITASMVLCSVAGAIIGSWY